MDFSKHIIRMPIWALALCGIVMASNTPLLAQQLTYENLPDFHLDYEASNSLQSIKEYVPRGETVQNWSRMITVQEFNGGARVVTPANFLKNLSKLMIANCQGAKASDVEILTVGNRPAAEIRVDCHLNPATNLPETMFSRVIAGDTGLYSVQVAFRSVPTEEETAWAKDYLLSVSLP